MFMNEYYVKQLRYYAQAHFHAERFLDFFYHLINIFFCYKMLFFSIKALLDMDYKCCFNAQGLGEGQIFY